MSEIFYSQVDVNLQQELDARALAGHRRSTADLNYMISKVANVLITAYQFNSKDVYAVDSLKLSLKNLQNLNSTTNRFGFGFFYFFSS